MKVYDYGQCMDKIPDSQLENVCILGLELKVGLGQNNEVNQMIDLFVLGKFLHNSYPEQQINA